MRRDEFEDSLDRYGVALADWPAASRAEAQQLCLRDPQAAASLAAAQRLREAVRILPDVAVPAQLWERLTAIPQRYVQLNLAGLWALLGPKGRWGGAVAMATAFALGVWLGGDAGAGSGDFITGFEPWEVM